MSTPGGEHIGVTFIGHNPPEKGQSPPPNERPGRIEYLYLTDKQKLAVEEMNAAIDELPSMTRLRCQNPQVRKVGGKSVAYYQHMDYDERTPPNKATALAMCKTTGRMCPVAAQCLKLGQAIEADLGVWGGHVFVDGEDYYNKEETHG